MAVTPTQHADGQLRPALNAASVLDLLKQTWAEWNEDKVPRLGAALSYYTIFSIAPLLIVVIAIAGAVFGEEAARGQVATEISSLVGEEAAKSVQDMIKAAGEKKSTGMVASAMGIITLLLGSSALFGQLQEALNTIWEVAPKPGEGFMAIIRQRFLSFSMVLVIGFLLLVSLALSAAVSAAGQFANSVLPMPEWTMQTLSFLVAFLVSVLMFGMIFKILPDAEVQWRDVWIGATLTALLFSIGRFALGLYLGKSGVSSTYGAAGSLVLILLWIYYASQILFFGAEFTQVYANRFGSKVKPSEHAIPLTDDMRAAQGMPRLSDMESTKIASEALKSGQSVRRVEVVDHLSPTSPVQKPGQKASEVLANSAGKPNKPRVEKGDRDYLSGLLIGLFAVMWWSERRDNVRERKAEKTR